jgi:hypothetical protein
MVAESAGRENEMAVPSRPRNPVVAAAEKLGMAELSCEREPYEECGDVARDETLEWGLVGAGAES